MKTYKVAILHSQTGTMANSESPLISATELAIKEINAAGGILNHAIDPVIFNGESRDHAFAKRATEINQQGIKNIFGY